MSEEIEIVSAPAPMAKQTKLGRAFITAIDSDWAITEEGYRKALAIAGRIKLDSAVETANSERLEYTRTASYRDGVAIIPIEGMIFRYADFFTYYCGGCTVENLAKDFRTALDDPKVHAILFEINSPGGEVTGVSELADMIYAARSKKPMTARVGGLMCSAALWLGTAAGDVVIDDTARVGSIGVMTAYLDDRKQMEMFGLEEIEFIASQSPLKNAKPWTDEGRKRIQARIDALCLVFGEKVALHRDVAIETVWKEFGQGDVFVGQDAIDAGLADRFGSFEDTVYTLAKTHNPYFVDTKTEFSLAQKTIKDFSAVNSQSNEIAENITAENSITNSEEHGEFMKPEEKVLDDAPTTPAKVAGAAPADEQSASATAPAKTDEVAALRAELAKRDIEKTESDKRIAALEAAATDKWIAETVKDFSGETAAHVEVLGALVAAGGKDSPVVAKYIEISKSQAAQLEASGIFAEIGKGGSNPDSAADAEGKLEALAKERAKSDKISYEKAYDLTLQENKQLANEVI